MIARRAQLNAGGGGIAAGLVLGLSFAGHPWLVFALGVAAGLAVAIGWRVGRRLLDATEARLYGPHRPSSPAYGPGTVDGPSRGEADGTPAELRDELLARMHRDLTLLGSALPRRRAKGRTT